MSGFRTEELEYIYSCLPLNAYDLKEKIEKMLLSHGVVIEKKKHIHFCNKEDDSFFFEYY